MDDGMWNIPRLIKAFLDINLILVSFSFVGCIVLT